jgi:hypothetical protein
MRRTGSAAALLGVLLLASCAITPPVLGGRPTDGPVTGAFTDEDVAALLIVDDPEAENVVLGVADYADETTGEAAAVCPGVVLLLPDDAAGGSVIVSPPLFRELPGPDLVVAQAARRFDASADAATFLADLRAARAGCPGVETVEGDFAVDAVGFATAETGSFEWVLVHANVAVSLSADLVGDDDAATLDRLAAEYSTRLAG